jgi:hypothetical protein
MSDQIYRAYQQLKIDVDMVLRGQGADPAVIRQRRPRLVELAEQALVEGMQLIQPVATYRILPIEEMSLESFKLFDKVWLTGTFVAQHLAGAQHIVLVVCTLGAGLENRIAALSQENPTYTFALDAFGSVAATTLRVAVCDELKADAQLSGFHTSIPLIPGINDWPVDVGQPQIFKVLDAARIGVSLNESAQMIPRKSISMMIGMSRSPFSVNST